MPARDAPVPAAYDTGAGEGRSEGTATEKPTNNTPVVVPSAAVKRKRQPPIAVTSPKSRKKTTSSTGIPVLRCDSENVPLEVNLKTKDYRFSIASRILVSLYGVPYEKWVSTVDKVSAMHDPNNVVPDDEAGYIYHIVSPHGKRDVRMDRDDPEAYSVFIERVKKGEVFVDDNGIVLLSKE